jgi:hypothetical protein
MLHNHKNDVDKYQKHCQDWATCGNVEGMQKREQSRPSFSAICNATQVSPPLHNQYKAPNATAVRYQKKTNNSTRG